MAKRKEATMDNVMIDLETLGTQANTYIVTLAAVAFMPSVGKVAYEFYEKIDVDSYPKTGAFSFDFQTLAWWMNQSVAARNEAFSGTPRKNIEVVLRNLAKWIRELTPNPDGVKVWSQGAGFDIPVLEYTMRYFNIEVPWKFWNVRDTRTLYDVAGISYSKVVPPAGAVAHNALADCLKQVEAVRQSMEKLGLTKKT